MANSTKYNFTLKVRVIFPITYVQYAYVITEGNVRSRPVHNLHTPCCHRLLGSSSTCCAQWNRQLVARMATNGQTKSRTSSSRTASFPMLL